jgi:hypothetical protein
LQFGYKIASEQSIIDKIKTQTLMKILKNKIVVMTFSLLFYFNFNVYGQTQNYDTLLRNVVEYVVSERYPVVFFFENCEADSNLILKPHFYPIEPRLLITDFFYAISY